MTSAANLTPEIVVLVLFVALIARRTYLMIRGARYRPSRLFTFTGFYVLLFIALAFPTLYAAYSVWGWDAVILVGPYVALPAIAGWIAVPYVRRIVRFEEQAPGDWYYKLPWLVPVLYLTLFIVRFALEIVVFGLAFATSFFLPTSIPTGLLFLLIGVDLTFGVSLGLLVGRSIGVYLAFEDRLRTPGASTPLRSSGPPPA